VLFARFEFLAQFLALEIHLFNVFLRHKLEFLMLRIINSIAGKLRGLFATGTFLLNGFVAAHAGAFVASFNALMFSTG